MSLLLKLNRTVRRVTGKTLSFIIIMLMGALAVVIMGLKYGYDAMQWMTED